MPRGHSSPHGKGKPMEYILQATATNGTAVVLLFSLILNYARKHYEYNRENKLFLTMLGLNLAQCVIETVTIIIDGKMFSGAQTLALILNSLLFINNIIFALHWSLYADAKVGYDRRMNKVQKLLRLLPASVVILAGIVNLFTPVFFSIGDDNIYRREWPFMLAYVATYIYLILGTIVICLHRKKTEKYNFLPVFTFLIPIFAASILQYFFQGISLLWAGAAIGLTSAYMSLLDESSVTDKLSGLYSRHYLNQYLSMLASKSKNTKQKMLGIMMDIDEFKSINDTHGHLIGDDAIVFASKIIRTSITTEKTVFRFAGDEFVVIMPIQSEKEIPKIIARIHNITEHFNLNVEKPYDLHFSIGTTVYISGENPKDFLRRMDEEMYKDKRKNKQIQKDQTI